jgi:hypothetical protein
MAAAKKPERRYYFIHDRRVKRTESRLRAILRIAKAVDPDRKRTIHSLGFREIKQGTATRKRAPQKL